MPDRESDMLMTRFGLVGASEAMKTLYESIERAAALNLQVLIRGDIGTETQEVARAIHEESARKRRPFVVLNCAATESSVLRSVLLRLGTPHLDTVSCTLQSNRTEVARGGSLLLNHIESLPSDLQAKLVSLLANTSSKAACEREDDVRILAATSRNLEDLLRAGSFSTDLYYQLSLLTIQIPKLKDRGDDVVALAKRFLQEASEVFGYPVVGFRREALDVVRIHTWPGNLLELRKCIFSAAGKCEGREIGSSDLQLETSVEGEELLDLKTAREKAERNAVLAALRGNDWKMARAASTLKISRMQLYRIVEKLAIGREGGD
jgi:two-component system NtrC family response regulator